MNSDQEQSLYAALERLHQGNMHSSTCLLRTAAHRSIVHAALTFQ